MAHPMSLGGSRGPPCLRPCRASCLTTALNMVLQSTQWRQTRTVCDCCDNDIATPSGQTTLDRQDLPCTYLAQHELGSANIVVIPIFINMHVAGMYAIAQETCAAVSTARLTCIQATLNPKASLSPLQCLHLHHVAQSVGSACKKHMFLHMPQIGG